jgi:protein subunit release factor B
MIPFPVTEKKRQQLLARMETCGLRESDLVESFFPAGGPGGQKVNKTATCVQLVHQPTGLSVKMQRSRSQPMNRFLARRRLCELLEEKQLGPQSPRSQEQLRIHKQKDRRRRRHREKTGRSESDPVMD